MFVEFSQYWWLVLLLIPLYSMRKKFIENKRSRQDTPLFQNNKNENIFPPLWGLKTGALLLGIFFLLLALWRPQWGEEIQKTKKNGLDIVFAVDVSKSMRALDFSQGRHLISRLDATKYLVENFIKNQRSNRIGLIEFAGESFVASPLTLDHNVFQNFLNNLSSDDLGKQGTNLAEAIEVSIERLEVQSDTERGKTILLFSDGDETISSNARQMAKEAKKKGIRVFTIGIGSEEEISIPEGRDAFGNIVYKKWNNTIVKTALNPDSLQEIASTTGGEYFHAENLQDLERLIGRLEDIPKKILTEENISPKSEQYFLFAFFGLLFFTLGWLFPVYPLFKKYHNT